jgi:rubrerythrin
LQGERRGYEFYVTMAAKSKVPDVAKMAKDFVKEEYEHVRLLEAWIVREEWALKKTTA